jgi:hypothetical protein
MDCLGNTAALSGRSMVLWSTCWLMHALYTANELYIAEDLDRVLVCGRGTGRNRRYDVVLSGLADRTAYNQMLARMESAGFHHIRPLARD